METVFYCRNSFNYLEIMMNPKFRKVLEIALEQGVSYGYNRAHKYVENPSESVIIDNIVEGVIDSLDDWFDFGENNYEV